MPPGSSLGMPGPLVAAWFCKPSFRRVAPQLAVGSARVAERPTLGASRWVRAEKKASSWASRPGSDREPEPEICRA